MKKIRNILLLVMVILIVFCAYEIKIGYDKYTEALNILPLETAVTELRSKDNYTGYKDIPQIYFDAVVSVEDRRFYKHNGFDFIGMARAIYNDIRAWELLEGGSTISQQLAKNMYFPQDKSIERKIAEIFVALKIEREYEKQDVLELYVNGIYYGSGYYSIYDAAKGYFHKKPIDMTDDECTLLAGIPNAPSVYSLDVNPDLAYQRQKKVLECMAECGYTYTK